MDASNFWTVNGEVAVEKTKNDVAQETFENVQPPVASFSEVSGTEISPWTNRVPDHEPWPRVMKQDSGHEQNTKNNGYLDNVDWIDQYDNVTNPNGLKPIGKVEGDEEIERGILWRR